MDEAVTPETPVPEPIPLRSIGLGQPRPGPVALPALANFPRPLTSLVGREADIAAARALLLDDGVQLLTLTGPGGFGKTRLALRLEEEVVSGFADGGVFVPLAAITNPDLVMPAIAQALGVRETDARLPTDLVADTLRGKRLLLMLDNFEQVSSAAIPLTALLAACPGVVAIVTSRALLHVAGEQRFPVIPLALPVSPAPGADRADGLSLTTIAASSAVQLFVARAKAVDPRFALGSENGVVIAAICRQLDGLPLAIELAAARIRLLSPAELFAHLGPTLPLLTEGPEDAPPRLRRMRDAIAWSYDLLSPQEQALFRRLAIFAGGFTLDAAEAVGGRAGQTVLDLVTSLVDKSLLGRIESSSGESRFAMLETIREFGWEQLFASGEAEAIAARHAAWAIDLAEDAREQGWLSQGRGLLTLELEHPNFRAALSWLLTGGEPTRALNLAGLLAEFWLRHGHLAEGKDWLERALAADDGVATAVRAEALVGLNMLLWWQGELGRAHQLLHEAEDVASRAGDAGALAHTRLHQGYVAMFQGDLDLAEARGEEALTTAMAISQGFRLNAPLWLLAHVALVRRDDERAAALHDRLLAAAREGGDEMSLANALYGMGVLAVRRGQPDAALASFAEATTVCHAFGDHLTASTCLVGAAAAAVGLARPESAVRLLAAAYTLRTALGRVWVGPDNALDDTDQILATARAELGAEQAAAAWTAGAALSLEEAFAEAADLAAHATPAAASRPAYRSTGLTSREREVLRLLVDGQSDKEIAAALGIGRRTVSNHVATIREKLDAPSRTAAAALAVRDRLI